MKTNNAVYLAELLINSVCNVNSVCDVSETYFLETFKVTYKGIDSIADSEVSDDVIALQIEFLEVLKNEVKNYFPEGSLKDFDIFVPKCLPNTAEAAATFGQPSIIRLAARFNLNPIEAGKEWTTLLGSMIFTMSLELE